MAFQTPVQPEGSPLLTASRSWGLTLLQAAERLGSSTAQVLQHAKVSPALLEQERWPVDDMTRLWRSAALLTGDAGFGLHAGQLVGPASFNVLGFLLQSSATLRDALKEVQRFQRLISDGGRFQLLPADNAVWLIYHPQQGELAFSPHQIEAVMAAVVRFASWLLQAPLAPLQAQFSHRAQASMAQYQAALACPVEFEQGFNGLLLPASCLDTRLPQADAQLANLHAHYAHAKLQAMHESDRTASAHPVRHHRGQACTGQVQQWLRTYVGTGQALPSRHSAATALGMSERSLRRRLSEEGTAYAQLLDQALQQACLHALRTSALPLAALALQLGFKDASTLHRACVRWTGSPPGAWRALYDNIQEPASAPAPAQPEAASARPPH